MVNGVIHRGLCRSIRQRTVIRHLSWLHLANVWVGLCVLYQFSLPFAWLNVAVEELTALVMYALAAAHFRPRRSGAPPSSGECSVFQGRAPGNSADCRRRTHTSNSSDASLQSIRTVLDLLPVESEQGTEPYNTC